MREPPREVSPLLAAQMYLGGASAQIGWLIFGFGSIFFWAFAWHADLSGWRFREGKIARVTGEILNCRQTNYASDDEPVFANEYHYMVGPESIGGVSYSTGDCASGQVTVEYLIGAPDVSRIAGMRRDVMGPWVILVAVLPIAGVVPVVLGLRKGKLRVALLRDGAVAHGRVVAKKATATETNGRRVYRITVGFTARDGRAGEVAVRSNRPEQFEGDTPVLCDPRNPVRALPMVALPGKISEDPTGRLSGGSAVKYAVLPILSLLINAAFVWING
jgi:hypothetical protein